MDSPTVLYAWRWLIYDTFRQALSSRVFWIMLGCSAICIVFCFGVHIEGGVVRIDGDLYDKTGKILTGKGHAPGRISLLFGAFSTDFARSNDEQVEFLQSVFASWIAGIVGVLGALVFTSGFLPEALQPGAASVLLAKPAPRWLFLTGKFVGVVCFVALQVTIFFLGTWIALGISTGYWRTEYLLGIPLLLFHFATIYSFSAMLAVMFRSPMACVVGTLVFWVVCYAVNYGRHMALAYPDLNPHGPPMSDFTVFVADMGYWLLPKPADYVLLLEKALNLGASKTTLEVAEPFKTVLKEDKDLFHPLFVILSSCLFPAFALWAAASQLKKTDY